MGILNYSTTIAAAKTASEVQQILSSHGADRISVFYVDRQPSALSFSIDTAYGPREYELPANVAGVKAAMDRQRRLRQIPNTSQMRDPQQPARVAWRILKDWTAAQLAVIEAGMATLDEVMLPYMLLPSGKTLTAAYRDSAERAAIEAGLAG